MKKHFFFLISLLIPFFLLSQSDLSQTDLKIEALGTGKTTGHIVNLKIVNKGENPISIKLDDYFIPSDGKHQGYIIPTNEHPDLMINPGVTTIPLNGFCTDITKPPVGDGVEMLPLDNWVGRNQLEPCPTPGTFFDESIFKPLNGTPIPPPDPMNPDGGKLCYLGTDILFPYTIDLDKHPEQAASLLFGAMDRITNTYDSLVFNDEIITPFSKNQDKQKESVIQQSFWIYTSILVGDPYTKNDFEVKMEEQFSQATGKDIEKVDSVVQTQYQSGIDQFWNTFELVGTKAKVIKPPEGSSFQDEIIIEKDTCICKMCKIISPPKFFEIDDVGNNKTIKKVENDSITWGKSMRYEPPKIKSDCPINCTEEITQKFKRVYKRRNNIDSIHNWTQGNSLMSLDEPGEMIFTAYFKVYCDGKFCCKDTIIKKLQIIETNDCCEKIRNNNNGNLILNFGTNNKIQLDNEILTLTQNGRTKTYSFPLNIESIFCNLKNGEIYGENNSNSTQTINNNTIVAEDNSNTSLMLERADENALAAQGIEPHYTFSLLQSENGDETKIVFTMDKITCKYDIQVLSNGQLTEFTMGSIYSYRQIVDQIRNLSNSPESSYWWHRMLFLYGQMLKDGNTNIKNLLHQKMLAAIDSLINSDGWSLITPEERRILLRLKSAINSNNIDQIIRLLTDTENLPANSN